ncbi:MAG: EamA family transporter [Flavobacteriales bacterium]|nr:EamA family transporter [Flavobacteriales bacterium]
MNKQLLAHLLLFVAQFLYGANYTIAKEAMPEFIQPFGFVLMRCLGGTALFWLVGLFVKEKIDRKDLPKLILVAVFGIVINQMMFFKGLSLTHPINAAVVMISTPIMVLIMAAIIIKERITSRKALGIGIGLVGTLMILVVGKKLSFSSDTFLGDVFIFINATAYGVYLVLISPLMKKYHPITVIKWVFLLGLFMVIPFGYEQFSEVAWSTLPPKAMWAMVYVVIGLSFFAYLFNTIALKYVSPSVVSTYIYLQPIVASLVAIWMGKDHLDWIKVLSAVLICIGVYLVSAKPKHPQTAGKEV